MPPKPINFDNVQGNIFGGFNKDFQDFLFLKVQDKTKARKWVKDNSDELISTSTQVLRFNNAFKALLASGVEKLERIITAEWANIAFSFKGLHALGFSAADFGTLPPEFTAGMAGRKADIGDVGQSDPSHWDPPFDPANLPNVHAILLIAADTEQDLNNHVKVFTTNADFAAGFAVLGTVHGRTRVDEVGHEHFGFKDGVSQPGIRGLNSPDDPLANPDQGHPGQDLLWQANLFLAIQPRFRQQSLGTTVQIRIRAQTVLPEPLVSRTMEVFLSFAGCDRTFLVFTNNLGTWRGQTG